MNNHDKWLASIALREAFETFYDNNDFTYSFNSLYPNLVGNGPARILEYRKFSGHIEHISKEQDTGYLKEIYNDVFVVKSDELKTPHGDFKINHQRFAENLMEEHLVDTEDKNKSGGKVYSVLIKGRYSYKASGADDDDYEREAVVISSDLGFIVKNLEQSIALERKRPLTWRIESAFPQEIQILEGSKVMFQIPLGPSLSEPDSKLVAPVLNEFKVVDATLNDLRVFDAILTPAQARRARGQLIAHDLGM